MKAESQVSAQSIPADWLEEFEAAAARPLRQRFKYAFIKTYKPILADSGPAGWDMIINHPPQAVILDLFMPEMNGFEIMEAMQASPDLREIPVIVISGGDLSASQQEKLDSLNLHLLQKGALDSKDLLTTLERSLNHLKKAKKKGNK